MALQSKLLRGDSKLEAAAVSDPAHIVPGASGAHVAKIQQALIELDDADINVDSFYGPKTAAAVLAFKQARNIINRSRQTKADNIVGIMTMAALDAEMLASESAPPISSARFTRANSADRSDGFNDGRRGAPDTVTSQQLQAFGLVAAPQDAPRFFEPTQLIVSGQVTVAALLSAKGATVASQLDEVVTVLSPGPQETVPTDAAFIRLRGGRPGQDVVIARDAAGREVARLRVITVAKIEREVSFTYLVDAKGSDGGVATTRTPGEEVALMQEVNALYNRQTGIFFKSKNRKLNVPELDANIRAVDLESGLRRAREWTKIYPKHRDRSAAFNVFYVKLINNKASVFAFSGGISEIVGSTADFRDTIIDNRTLNKVVQSDAMNLAHELGHACGEPHNKDPRSLMSDKNAVGTTIDLPMALRMRKNLERFTQQ